MTGLSIVVSIRGIAVSKIAKKQPELRRAKRMTTSLGLTTDAKAACLRSYLLFKHSIARVFVSIYFTRHKIYFSKTCF